MGVAEEYQDHVVFGELSEPRLSQPESGLYATVVEVDGNYEWRSPSALTTNVEFPETRPDLGEFVFSEVATGGVARYFLTYAVIWEDAQESVRIGSTGIATSSRCSSAACARSSTLSTRFAPFAVRATVLAWNPD